MDVRTVPQAAPSPTDTEPDRATWHFWPNGPPGDFARLIPVSEDARLAFQAIVGRMLAQPTKEPWPYSSRFIHWECADLDDPESQVALESTPETSTCSDPGRSILLPQKSPVLLPYTGYYRLNMLNPQPDDLANGWVLGAGRKGRNGELVLTTAERKSEDRIFGRHAKLLRSLDSGAVIVATDSHPITVDGHQLSRQREIGEDPGRYQRVASSKSSITLGRLVYKLQMQDLPPEIDKAQVDSARRLHGTTNPGPSFFLTPTPSMAGTLLGSYHVFEAFAAGSGGTVHYVTHAVTGKPYALKRMKKQHEADQRAIRNEIDTLRGVSHPYACRFVEEFRQEFDRPDIRNTHGFAEICVVLEPPAWRSLKDFLRPSPTDEPDTVVEAKAARQHFLETVLLQLADIGAYLHSAGIMHRDYKLDNIGVVRESPEVEVVLLDFGQAIRAKTIDDHMKGTVRYLAPEVLALKHGRSRRPYTCAVDVWAPGVVMMELDMQRQVRDERMAEQWATELQQRPRGPRWTRLQSMLPRLLCADAEKRITMQQVFDTLSQQVDSAGKRKAEGGDAAFNRAERSFSRQIVLDQPSGYDPKV